MKRFWLGALALLAVCIGCGPQAPVGNQSQVLKNDRVSESPKESEIGVVSKKLVPPEESFEVTLPTGSNWKIQQGAIGKLPNTFLVAASDLERKFALSLTVMPSPNNGPDLSSAKTGWERGFLKNATRKKSSEDITLAGRPAFRVTAEVDLPSGDSFEITGILIVNEGRSFSLTIAKPGENALEEPEARQFLETFKIID